MKVFQNPTGNSIEDEQNSKRHARRVRVYLIIFALWIAFLVILATILTPILVLQHEDSEAEKAYRAEENDLANNFTTEFRDAVLNAISAVYGLQGYIMGEMKSLPDLNASKEKRVAGQYFDTFDRYAQLVQSSAASIAVFLTAPGGVTYQFYPEDYGESLSNWDLLDEEEYGPVGNWSDPAVARQSPWYSIETGWLAITGPYNTSSLPFVEHCEGASCHNFATRRPPDHFETDDTWWIDLRQPVYQATAQAEASTDTFWGFAMAALNVDELLETNCFEETMDAHNMHYTVFTNTSSNDCIVIVSSWPGEYDCTVPFMRDFINAATVHDVLGDQLAWKVAVKSALRQSHLTSHVRLAIVLSSVFGTAFIFAIVVYIIILCTRVYDGAAHAPKLAPFAMLTVGPCRGEELWELASDQMVDVKDRLGRVLARQMVRHRAYQIQQVHPLTTSYVTRSVAAAVQMAFDAIEELQSSPIDEPLRRLLGDDCGLLLSYAVHWCNDAVVRLDPMEGGYRYEGPDMVYGGRMWVFAAPNVVTVSPTALPAAKRLPHVRYKVFDSVFLRGVTARQDLYVLSNPSNHKLCEAEAVAAEQVRRARQAQREMAEIRGSEGDPHKRRLTYSFNPNGYDSSDLDAGSFAGRPRYPAGGNGRDGNWDALTLSNSNSFSDHSTPSSALRSRAVVVARAGKREGVAANPTSIIVPPSTKEAPLPSCAAPTGGHVNPLLFPSQAQERRMVRRPNRGSATSTEASGSSPGSSPTASDDEAGAECAGNKLMETFVEGCAVAEEPHQESPQPPTQTARLQQSIPYGMCVGPLPALPPIVTTLRSTPGNPTAVPAAATVSVVVGAGTNAAAPAQTNAGVAPLPGMSSRRVLDTLYSGAPGAAATAAAAAAAACGTPTTATTTNSSSITTIGTGQRHGEVSSPKPLVMVPPSTEVVAAGGHGMASKSSSATPSSDSVTHGRRGNGGPSSAYDNPLAHNLAAGPLSMPAGGGGGGGLPSGGGGGKQMRASLEDGGFAGAASAPLVAMASFPGAGDPLADSRVSLDTFSSDLLFRPAITVQADHLLRTVFDRQAVALDVSYDSVRVLVYYFYSSYKILFRPLAAPERHNIYRRLMAAFGVPQQGILEHLAARCAIRFLQRHEETQTLLWDQQRRLQAHASSRSGVTTTTASTSDEAASRSSIN